MELNTSQLGFVKFMEDKNGDIDFSNNKFDNEVISYIRENVDYKKSELLSVMDLIGAQRFTANSFIKSLKQLPVFNDMRNVLDIGSGPLGLELFTIKNAFKNLKLETIDPNLILTQKGVGERTTILDGSFQLDTNISNYDAVIGNLTCEATEDIIETCTKLSKPYFITLCDCLHPLRDGTKFNSYNLQNKYFEDKYSLSKLVVPQHLKSPRGIDKSTFCLTNMSVSDYFYR